MKISIVIPAYEMHGKGEAFLRYNIERILAQTFNDYNVIISDHSIGDELKTLVESFNDNRLVYLKNLFGRGSSTANLNFGVSNADGQIIKPIFQDDYLFATDALDIIHNDFLRGYKWVSTGCNHTEDRTLYYKDYVPSWNNDMVYGHNTMSSPSCIAYLKSCDISWDERLLWLIDCKFYYEMFKKYGLPYFENRILITNFKHSNQVTNLLSKERKQWEVDLMKKEYPR
jgi:glycosyltransferase involved in cell wall biosynthesis